MPLTASHLLAYLVVAFLAQAAVGMAVALRRRAQLARAAAAAVLPARAGFAGAWPGWRAFRVARRQHEDTAQSQCSFLLEPVNGAALPPYKPGQFLTFEAPAGEPSAPGQPPALTRCYSLSDRPRPDAWRITVKRVPAPAGRPELPPGAASTWLHDHVHAGDLLQVKAPAGDFFIDPDPALAALPVVLVAGGIGITPLMSMLRWCLDEQPQRQVRLYYGVRHGGEHAFKGLLEQLAAGRPNFHLTVAYSQPQAGDVLGRDFTHAGRVDVALLRATLPARRHLFYVCGPAPLMATLVPALRAWGVPAEDIHHEAFGPASVPAVDASRAGAAVAWAVQFTASGRTLAWQGNDANLLDFAERHGIAVESGCRVGGCGTCETRLVSGRVDYAARPAFDISPGHCLLCVGRPATALVLAA